MRSKRAAKSGSKAINGFSLFGPPPLLEGEDAGAYEEILARIFNAVRSPDVIEEIWMRDLTDVAWTLLRLRRIQAAFLSAKVEDEARAEASDEATSLAEAEVEIMEGVEKEEMIRFLTNVSDLSPEALAAQNPRADKKFQEFYESAMSTLDMSAIQARVMLSEFDSIEKIDRLIEIAERRFDTIIREMDRHRVMRDSVLEGANFKNVTPKVSMGQITNKKVA